MHRPTPGLSLEGSRHSSVPRKFSSWEGIGVGSWSQSMRESDRGRSMGRRPALQFRRHHCVEKTFGKKS